MKNTNKVEMGRTWFETVRATAEQIPANAPYRQDETLAQYFDWMQTHAGSVGCMDAIKHAQKHIAEVLRG
jgi:hypothetical protein